MQCISNECVLNRVVVIHFRSAFLKNSGGVHARWKAATVTRKVIDIALAAGDILRISARIHGWIDEVQE
jgi:hypothetical protein